MTIQEALVWAMPLIPQSSPRLDAEVLLSLVTKKDQAYLLAHFEKELTKLQEKKYRALIKRRAKHEPVAYLTGHQAFYDLDFMVNKNILIPRPETELMIDYLKDIEQTKKQENKKTDQTIIDIGTGSGCIIITTAKHKLGKQYFAIDISKPALVVAKKNAKTNKQNNIEFMQGNLLEPIIKKLQTKKIKITTQEIIITANLPYVLGGKKAVQTLIKIPNSTGLKYEPRIALFGGADGLKYYRILEKQLETLQKLLPNKKITVLCEIDQKQKQGIKNIFQTAKKIIMQKDLAKMDRLAIIEY